MSQPDFKVGDEVECEEQRGESGYPRYDNTVDRGGNGKWIKGKIDGVCGTSITAKFSHAGSGIYYWTWNVDEKTWQLPGQLRHVKAVESLYSFKKGYFKALLNDGYFPEFEVKLLGKRKYK